MKQAICERCGGPTAHQNVWQNSHRHLPDCLFFLKSIRNAAAEVAALDWGTSVTESFHHSRMASMERLRGLLTGALPAKPDEQPLSSTVNSDSPDFGKGK